ncbi:UbiH/UbiF/VisC/COQ6 family ubiquinone biosynthesis hydroxylase [Telmatospirillum sp. J64-1]|uniref:UbiH/UbiF/VisC/COQ6 family ubiquinone biosynthesis hydroxylase n=1 Tax=Telmatospirillum sp. J64-1 TaxID=2502183 RepID=UPI00115E115E|nr:UbiH/UbiF/VisC/COQ6 family ubiquinone biosynthesis hydroxylase [Telmatospirillum sp. J64-1]
MTIHSPHGVDIRADILVIGGGLVGGAMACALAKAGISVAVVDHEGPAAAMAAEFDGRSSAIALGPKRVLEVAGLWDAIAPEAGPILEIRVSDGPSLMFLHYDHKDVGDEPFGWIVENRTTRKAIFSTLPQLDKAQLIAPAQVVGVERGPLSSVATLSDGRRIEAQLVIAADGRGSATRKSAGIDIRKWEYGQTAIVCTVAHEKPHRGIAQEHFLPAGPFAILPMTGNRSSLVWTEKSHLVPAIMAQDDKGFLSELSWRFGDFLGDIAVEGPRFSYPLSVQFADSYIARRLALIGDAAHGMHPVAGQGMNYGLRDVAVLAEVLVESHRLGLDLGSPAVLDRYQRLRRFDNMLMLGLTDALVRLFSNDIGPIRLARDIGLGLVNRMTPLKKVFMRHAMGEIGTLPRMMRGEAL